MVNNTPQPRSGGSGSGGRRPRIFRPPGFEGDHFEGDHFEGDHFEGDHDEGEYIYICDPDDRIQADCTPCREINECEYSFQDAEGPQDYLFVDGDDTITYADWPGTGDVGLEADDAVGVPVQTSAATQLLRAAAAIATGAVLLLLV